MRMSAVSMAQLQRLIRPAEGATQPAGRAMERMKRRVKVSSIDGVISVDGGGREGGGEKVLSAP